MISRKFTDGIKSGFGRVKQTVKSGIENFPKVVQKTVELSRKIRDGANKAKQIADKVQPIYEKNKDLIENPQTRSKIEKGFKTGNKVVENINRADSIIGQVGNAIMS